MRFRHALAASLVALSVGAGASSPDLVAHEWGTFTSVAGPDGCAVDWTPFNGPSDLPRFVTILNPTSLKIVSPKAYLRSVKASVRMETPVIYFYTGREQEVNVRVRFPQGLITEWYPQAAVPPVPALPVAKMTGGIAWKDVRITPGARAVFPNEGDKSHYYAARDTDAAPVVVGGQTEKFLFYRGLASFPVAVSARMTEGGSIDVANTGAAIGTFILFENRGGRLGYSVVRGPGQAFTMRRPALTSTFDALRRELQATLTAEGLYEREASAMIETWRDSWFESGTRLFYVMPQKAVDEILPLEIEPRPAKVVRTFVGRIEIITPEIMTEVEQAIRARDVQALVTHGRFLEPIAERIRGRLSSPADQVVMKETLAAVAATLSPTPAPATR